MPVEHDSGYMAKIEASHPVIQPMPDTVIIKLKCYVPSECAPRTRPPTRPRIMFVEPSLSEAMARQSAHAHSAGLL